MRQNRQKSFPLGTDSEHKKTCKFYNMLGGDKERGIKRKLRMLGALVARMGLTEKGYT